MAAIAALKAWDTYYRADGLPITGNPGPQIGHFGSFIYAGSRRTAQRLAKRRNIGERVCLFSVSGADTPVSALLRRKRVRSVEVIHGVCFLGFLAIQSGVATPTEILGDKGVLHEVIHHFQNGSPARKTILAMVEDLERRVPGYLPSAKTRRQRQGRG